MSLDDLDLANKLGQAIAYSPSKNKTTVHVVFGIKYGKELQGRVHQVVYLARQTQRRGTIFDGVESSLPSPDGLSDGDP